MKTRSTTFTYAVTIVSALFGVLGNERVAQAQSAADGHCANLSGEKNGGFEWKQPPIRNTVGYRVMTAAILSNNQSYGAVNMAERRLIPLLMANGRKAAMDMDTTFTVGAVALPLCPSNESPKLSMGQVDLSVVNIGVGGRIGPLGLFLATSVASHTVYTASGAFTEGLGRGSVGVVVPLMALSYWPVSLLKSELYRENVSVVYTHVLGASIATPVGPITAGYATSKGVFGNLTGSKIPVFASALLGTKFDDISYLSAGLASIRSIASTSWTSSVGDTSIFGRRLLYTGLTPQGTGNSLVSNLAEKVPFVTQHLEQSGIGKVFDLTVVSTTSPQPNIYEGTVTVHSVGYQSPRSVLSRFAAGETSTSEKEVSSSGLAFSAGFVRLPDMWYYGIEGGYRLKLAFNYVLSFESKNGGGLISLGIAMNDSDILAVFPYAYNAPQFSAMLAGGF